MDSRKTPQRGSVGLVVLVIIILALGLLGGFLFYFKNQQITPVAQPSTQQKRAETTTAPAKADTTLLYPNIKWIPKPQVKSTLAVIRVANDKTNQTTDVNLSGKTWVYKKKSIKTLEEFNQDSLWGTILSYYQDKLSGWTRSITSGDYTIEAISADGGGASMMGYLKKTDDTIQVISLLSQTTFAKGEFPIDADCPCDTQYEVFISDDYPLDKLFSSSLQ